MSELISLLSEINWDDIKSMQSADEVCGTITKHILHIFNSCAPLVKKRITRTKAQWYNNEVKELAKKKNKCKKSFLLNTNSSVSKEEYCKARNQLNSAIRRAKKSYFSENLNCKDSKKFWASLRAGGAHNPDKDFHHDIPFSPDDMNSYFANMGCNSSINLNRLKYFQSNESNDVIGRFRFENVSENEVMGIISNISTKAFGIDGISIGMVKVVSPYCIGALTHLVNLSLSTGCFPSAWRQSVVIPVPKTKTPTSVSQFRPISILPVLSKVIEKVVASQLGVFIERENILPETQSGFRKGFSTTSALINVTDELFVARDNSLNSILTALDFAQAFDSVNHNLFLAKLRFYKADEIVLKWFSSYLINRTQVTKINGLLSEKLPKLAGVPQGSCLGPIMFLLYTADIQNELSFSSLHTYADDTQILLSYSPAQLDEAVRRINSDLSRVKCWSEDNGLKLNSDKCSVVHFTSPRSELSGINIGSLVSIYKDSLTESQTVKILGITFDSQLKFDKQVSSIYRRVIPKLKVLQRFKTLIPTDAKLMIVRGLILPIIHYALPVFGYGLTQENCTLLQRLENSAVRFVYNKQKYDHISEFRKAAGIPCIKETSKIEIASLVHKVLSTRQPRYLRAKLISRSVVRDRNTRQDAMLQLPQIRTEAGRKAFSYFGPYVYNALPPLLKSASHAQFKKN